MALIYQKDTEKTLILSPRESYQRAFDFGLDWTEIRLGMYFSGISAAGDNSASVNETVNINNASDRIAYGIKNSTNTNYPGTADSIFIGALSNGSSSQCNGENFYSQPSTLLAGGGLYGITQILPGSPNLGAGLIYPNSPAGSTSYCGAAILRIVISNRGLSNQSVVVSSAFTKTISGSDYSSAALRTLMNNASWVAAGSFNWNDGSVAYPIPDAFYIRLPFYNNRIRISCMRATRYA